MNKWFKIALSAFVSIIIINLFIGLLGGFTQNSIGYNSNGYMMNQNQYNGYYQMPMYNGGQSMPMHGQMGGMGMRGMR